MQILKVTDEAFRQYGKVIKDLDVSDIITAMSETPCPDDVVYEPSIESLEACKSAQSVSDSLYGGMPIQIGYCNATTLHYAPCNVAASGFKCVVVLPKGTNTDITLEEKHTPEDDLLFARNKWLLSHPDANIAGSVAGIKGENLSVK